METTRVFECMGCGAEIIQGAREGPVTRPARSGEFAATVVLCPACGTKSKYDTGAASSGDSPLSVIVPCEDCGTVVEAYGVHQEFVDHVREEPALHDLHR